LALESIAIIGIARWFVFDPAIAERFPEYAAHPTSQPLPD
jgi:hypothetical protein